ncbi:unnamed protein product [Cylicostephanus goldi]|uniref:Uncharacterized protein n=1 Tax=Cylicostephanus goldi TaxID=71465 RepID=A0A3P7MPX3_CYLGO|nr:unnamed protein product [Cylicostephanus goldi]
MRADATKFACSHRQCPSDATRPELYIYVCCTDKDLKLLYCGEEVSTKKNFPPLLVEQKMGTKISFSCELCVVWQRENS